MTDLFPWRHNKRGYMAPCVPEREGGEGSVEDMGQGAWPRLVELKLYITVIRRSKPRRQDPDCVTWWNSDVTACWSSHTAGRQPLLMARQHSSASSHLINATVTKQTSEANLAVAAPACDTSSGNVVQRRDTPPARPLGQATLCLVPYTAVTCAPYTDTYNNTRGRTATPEVKRREARRGRTLWTATP